MMNKHIEKGFTHSLLLVVLVVIATIGLVGWRIASVQQKKESSQQQTAKDEEGQPIQKLSSEEQQELKAQNGDIPPTAETTPAVATTKTTPPKPVNNSNSGTTSPAQQTPATPPNSSSPPAPSVLRPTAEFCAQKNGASFTNVWFTGTGTYTYDGYAWENGYSYSLPRVSKTETGTPLRNYDTMQIFDVVEYGTQPKWAICSDKAGYVMVYYSVPNSPYTFNVLAEYGHLSLQQP